MRRWLILPSRQWVQTAVMALLLPLHLNYAQATDLLEVYNQAALEDPQLEKAKEALSAVQETQNQTSANLFQPQVNITSGVSKDWQNIQNFGKNVDLLSNGANNFYSWSYSLNLTQPILHYDRFIQWRQADSKIAQAEAQFAAAEIALLLRVAERYFEVLATEENLIFAKAQAASLTQKLTETKQHEAAGYMAMTDVYEAQSGSDRALADVVDAEHKLRDAREGLQEATGIHYSELAQLTNEIPLAPPEPAVEDRWVEQALHQNLALKADEFAIEIAKAEVEVQQAGHLPTLDLNGSHYLQHSSGGRFGGADIEDSNIGLTLNVPIYQGGQVNSKTREAQHRHRESQANLKQTQRSVQRQTSQAFLGVTAGISRVKALQKTLKSSAEAVKATEAGFRSGYRTPLDMIVAERDHLGVQRDLSRARYDYVLNTLRLKQAVGILSPEDLIKVNGWLEGGKQKN